MMFSQKVLFGKCLINQVHFCIPLTSNKTPSPETEIQYGCSSYFCYQQYLYRKTKVYIYNFQFNLFKFPQTMAFSSTKLKNVGGKLLIIKQQTTHQKRLQQIYDRAPQHYASSELIRKKNPSCSKLVQHQNYEHHKNIEHLFKFISRKKNMADRLKDPHDFFAYPVYFFREEKPKSHKNKAFDRKKKRPIAHSYDNQSEQSQFTRRYGIDVPTVKQMLPTLQKFSQQELEQYAGSIEKIISNYNLQTSEQIDFLKNCVLKTSLPHYPREFGEIVEEIFDDIANSLG